MYRPFGVEKRTSLFSEPAWAPPAGEKWENTDYNAEFKKLQEEAEIRLDNKIEELIKNLENVGKKK